MALFVRSVKLSFKFREGSSGSYGPLPGWPRFPPSFCSFWPSLQTHSFGLLVNKKNVFLLANLSSVMASALYFTGHMVEPTVSVCCGCNIEGAR